MSDLVGGHAQIKKEDDEPGKKCRFVSDGTKENKVNVKVDTTVYLPVKMEDCSSIKVPDQVPSLPPKKRIVVEVVGLLSGDQGRSCEKHDMCGSNVQVGNFLIVKKITHYKKGVLKPALAVYSYTGTVVGCLVGFLCRDAIPRARIYDGKVLHVEELHYLSPDKEVRRNSNIVKGSAKTVIV